MKLKKCSRCKQFKPLEEFCRATRAKDGLNWWCRDCCYENNLKWGKKNRERLNRYAREYRKANREKDNQSHKEWRRQNPERWKGIRCKYIQNNREKHRAQVYACTAYPERQNCEVEGCFGLGERHHPDYSKPYQFTWLCRKHHKLLHQQLKIPVLSP